LGIPFFADHIGALTKSFYSKLIEAGNPLVRQLSSRDHPYKAANSTQGAVPNVARLP